MNTGSAALHTLHYHLQHAATLEYDRQVRHSHGGIHVAPPPLVVHMCSMPHVAALCRHRRSGPCSPPVATNAWEKRCTLGRSFWPFAHLVCFKHTFIHTPACRLDAKLLLLPTMARLGRRSAEIDAWLQVGGRVRRASRMAGAAYW